MAACPAAAFKANISQVSGRFSVAAIHISMLPSFMSDQQISASLEEHIHKFKKKADSRWNAACNSPGNSLPSMLHSDEPEKVTQNSGRLLLWQTLQMCNLQSPIRRTFSIGNRDEKRKCVRHR